MIVSRRVYVFWAVLALAAASCPSGVDGPVLHRGEKVCSLAGAVVAVDAVCGCTRIEGDVAIDAGPAGDLRCLDTLREVTGRLTITSAMRSPTLTRLRGLAALRSVEALVLSDLPVVDLKVFSNLETAQEVSLSNLDALATLEGLAGEFDRFQLKECDALIDLRGLRANIREFRLENNARLRSLEGFVGLEARPGASSGPDARIEANPELESLEGLFRSEQQAIQRLHLLGLPKLASVDLRSASELSVLVVRTCTALQEIRGVDALESIGQLHLTGLTALPRLPDFKKLARVGDLELIELTQLTDLAPLSSLTAGDAMALNMLDSLSSLHGLEQLSSAGRLLLEDLPALESVDGLRGLQRADTLWFSDNDKLESLRGLSLKSATELAVRYNDKLQTLDGLEQLETIGTLDFSENPKLVSVRALRSLREAAKIFARANGQLPQCELDRLAMRLPAGSTHEFRDNGPVGPCPP